jgi:AcrR family transcriptional regulator
MEQLTHPRQRPGGRSERIRQAVLSAAAELVSADPASVTVAALARRSGVSEVTIYRRWGTADNVLLEAAVEHAKDRLLIPLTRDVRADLTAWAKTVERAVAEQPGLGLFTAVTVAAAHGNRDALQDLLKPLRERIQALLDAADPPVLFTVEDTLDRIAAPLYLRALLDYTHPARGPEQLVDDLLSGLPPSCASRPL